MLYHLGPGIGAGMRDLRGGRIQKVCLCKLALC